MVIAYVRQDAKMATPFFIEARYSYLCHTEDETRPSVVIKKGEGPLICPKDKSCGPADLDLAVPALDASDGLTIRGRRVMF
jgi:hypothetical protein